MKKSGSKVLVIVLIIMALLAIAGGVFAYVCLATDMLKSEQELFAKYLTQNLEELTQTINLDKVDELEEKLKQNKYEETITISYTEEGETLATGTTTIDIQKDPIDKKSYGIISLETQDPEETLKLEYMHEGDMYSIRFTNAVLQFFSIENSNLKELATTLGADEEVVELIPDAIDFESLSLDEIKFTDEEKSTELNRYANTLYNNIAREKYTKSKNTVITVNGKTITTNAYILTLNMQDMKTLAIKLLETLKQDEIVLAKLQMLDEMIEEYIEEYSDESLKDSFVESLQESIDELTAEEITEEKNIVITIYEENGKTVRIKAEQGLEYITLDTNEVEGKKQIDINYTNIDANNTQLSNGITFIKKNDNNLVIKLNTVDGEEQQSYEMNIELTENGDNVKLNITLDDEEGQTAFTRNINFVQEIEYEVTLDDSNNIIINDLSLERLSTIFTLVGDKINTKYVKGLKTEHLAPLKLVAAPISALLVFRQGQEAIFNTDLSEAETAAFNAKFESYEGNKVSTADVNALLSVVFSHNQMEANNLTEQYVVVTGDIEMGSDAIAATKLEGDKLYTVRLWYASELVCKIEITEYEENSSLSDIIDDAEEFIENDESTVDDDSSITSGNMEYNPAESASVIENYYPTGVTPIDPDSEDTIVDAGNRVMGMLRTIGTIAIVILLFL